MCFGAREVILHKLHYVGSVYNVGGVNNTGENLKCRLGGKKQYIHLGSCDFLVQLMSYDDCDSYSMFCWLTNPKPPSLHLANHYAPLQ